MPPPMLQPSQPKSSLGRQALIALGGILIALAIYIIGLMLFSKAPGKLNLNINPNNARVSLNGELIQGSPPYSLDHLRPREDYQLRVTAPGFEPMEKTLYLFPHWTKSVDIQLNKKATGVIEVQSDPPGAALYIDGQMTGKKTPVFLEVSQLKFPLTIGLSKGGPPQWTQGIPVAPRKTMKIKANLKARFGLLEIRSKPSGAQVFLGDRLVGKTPLYSLKVPSEEALKLRLVLKGYRPFNKSLSLKPGQREEVSTVFKK